MMKKTGALCHNANVAGRWVEKEACDAMWNKSLLGTKELGLDQHRAPEQDGVASPEPKKLVGAGTWTIPTSMMEATFESPANAFW